MDDIFAFTPGNAEISPENRQRMMDYDALINRVFSTEDGKKLLEKWVKAYIFEPTVIPGRPIESHGIREGQKMFVRLILGAIEKIENNYYQKQENSNE